MRASIVAGGLLAVLSFTPRHLLSQTPATAATYRERLDELMRALPRSDSAARITSPVTIQRDAGRLVFERGTMHLLGTVGGRRMGAVFRGTGRFVFEPSTAVERAELHRWADTTMLDAAFSEVVLLFADSTREQLRQLAFEAAPGEGVDAAVSGFLNSLKGDNDGSFDSDVMDAVLNGGATGLFMARIERTRGGAVLFELNPRLAEGVRLYKPVGRIRWGRPWAVVTQFAGQGAAPADRRSWFYRDMLRIGRYTMDVGLSEAFAANIIVNARAAMTLEAVESLGPWLLFHLHEKLDVDSARWSTGETAAFFKAHESGDLWVRAARRLQPGDTLSLTLHYRGDMIDRYGNFFYVDPGANWFPVNGHGDSRALFDVTFRSPRQYPLISMGEKVDSSIVGNVRMTRWVTRQPVQAASFNLGLFQDFSVQHEGAPRVDVLMSDDAHSLLRRRLAQYGIQLPEQRNMRENVAIDVSNSLKLFTALLGAPTSSRFYVTEIPYAAGVSFPGLIHLSWGTFQNTSLDGFDEFFRAHEVAHQWWGNDVRPGSYRDAWLSEGLATFAGLMYLEAVKRRTTEVYRFLDQYRAEIDGTGDNGPIDIGWRSSTPDVPRAYHTTVYEKGAWVFQMLRVMMTDLNTMRSERFAAMLRDFYATYGGRVATTEDFQQLVERHMGMPMGWFFDQWVRGTAVPRYRVAWRAEPADAGRFRVRLRVTQERVPAHFQMPVLVAADLGGDRTARFRVMINGSQTEYLSPLLPAAPREVVFNDMRSTLAEVNTSRW